jgi:histidine triad (HIT) family protein
MSDCIFCKIVEKKIPAKIVYEDELVFAFEDMNPQAPVHILVIPKKHIATLLEVSEEDFQIFGHMMKTSTKIAREKGIAGKGFRVITNCNPDGGQVVYHVHQHILGGRQLRGTLG